LIICKEQAKGLRYPRWGRDGKAFHPEKVDGVEKCLKLSLNPQRQGALRCRV